MTMLSFTIRGFVPAGCGLPRDEVIVYGCSNTDLDDVPGKKGVVVYLHGAGASADSYADIYPHYIRLPSDYNVIFLSTPRADPVWMYTTDAPTLNYHWVNAEVVDSISIVSTILEQVAVPYGGLEHVWVAGFSQGAVIASAVALQGLRTPPAGAFAVAGYPPRPLYTDEDGPADLPSGWSRADAKRAKFYFLTGEFDGVLPTDQAFCRYNRVLQKYGVPPSNYRFWSKLDWCHYETEKLPSGETCHNQISPNGQEFIALWDVVRGDPSNVTGVLPISPDGTCKT